VQIEIRHVFPVVDEHETTTFNLGTRIWINTIGAYLSRTASFANGSLDTAIIEAINKDMVKNFRR